MGLRPFSVRGEGLCFLASGVQFADRRRVAEKETGVADLAQGVLQGFVAVHAEVGGDDAERPGGGEVLAEVIDEPAGAVVEDVFRCRHLGTVFHTLTTTFIQGIATLIAEWSVDSG